jgi:hypothetical protein
MFERVLIALWCARRQSAVHAAAAVRHGRRPAMAASSCPGSTWSAQVHGQAALPWVDPLFSPTPLPLQGPGAPAAGAMPNATLHAFDTPRSVIRLH